MTILYATYHYLYKYLRVFIPNDKVDDPLIMLKNLGQAREPHDRIKGTAIIAGNNLSGLMAARVCSDHFQRVVIVDPDPATYIGRFTSYTSNGGYCNASGKLSLETYRKCFSDWDDRITGVGGIISGSPPCFLYGNVPIYPHPATTHASASAYQYTTAATLETTLRRAILETCPNVSLIHGSILAINADDHDDSRISSVSIKTYFENSDGEYEQYEYEEDASLVIDCTGPTRAGLRWLSDAGYGLSSATNRKRWKISRLIRSLYKLSLNQLTASYNPNITITTIRFPHMVRSTMGLLQTLLPVKYLESSDPLSIHVFPSLKGKVNVASSGTLQIANHCLSVSCATRGIAVSDFPETQIAEAFRALFENIRTEGSKCEENKGCEYDSGLDAVDNLFYSIKPDEISEVQSSACYKIRYDRAADLPSNFIAIGKSCMEVNGVYGLEADYGIMGCLILDDALHDLLNLRVKYPYNGLPKHFSSRFFDKQAKKVIKPIWTITKAIDYGFKTTTPQRGESLWKHAILRWYMHYSLLASAHYPKMFAQPGPATINHLAFRSSPLHLFLVAWVFLGQKVTALRIRLPARWLLLLALAPWGILVRSCLRVRGKKAVVKDASE